MSNSTNLADLAVIKWLLRENDLKMRCNICLSKHSFFIHATLVFCQSVKHQLCFFAPHENSFSCFKSFGASSALLVKLEKHKQTTFSEGEPDILYSQYVEQFVMGISNII